jgi:probable HAF family extracellular repeat protein
MKETILALLFVILIATGFATFAICEESFSIRDLGTLAGLPTFALAINEEGMVVGVAGSSVETYHTVIWKDGEMIDIGSLGGAQTLPWAMNGRGQIVGQSDTSTPGFHAFLWQDGVLTDLGTLGGSFSVATSINVRGQVVGYSFTADNTVMHGFLWEDGSMKDLGPTMIPGLISTRGEIIGGVDLYARLWNGNRVDLSSLSEFGNSVNSVNERGDLAGQAGVPPGIPHAALWRGSEVVDLGVTGYALDINASGQVLCHSIYDNHAFLWEKGTLTDLGSLGGSTYPRDLNDVGQVVGMSRTSTGTARAFLWERGRMTALGPLPGFDESEAAGINNRGQIVGSSDNHAVLWSR